jgi:hypothetical protein
MTWAEWALTGASLLIVGTVVLALVAGLGGSA